MKTLKPSEEQRMRQAPANDVQAVIGQTGSNKPSNISSLTKGLLLLTLGFVAGDRVRYMRDSNLTEEMSAEAMAKKNEICGDLVKKQRIASSYSFGQGGDGSGIGGAAGSRISDLQDLLGRAAELPDSVLEWCSGQAVEKVDAVSKETAETIKNRLIIQLLKD